MRKSLFLFVCLLFSLSAIAGRPKIGPGYTPGLGDNDGNTTGGTTNTEVTLPVGLPLGDDAASATNPENSSVSNIVYTFDISPEDGAASANQTHSAFEKAKNMNAACVLIRIDGFAGGWDVAENIRQEMISYDRPVMVYVNNQTIPAANFISLGADSIYTKKGSTISNKKGATKNQKQVIPVQSESAKAQQHAHAETSSSNPDELYANDVTMNEILYKAGLGNLTVVEHKASLSERITDFLMNAFVVMTILLLLGFIMRKAVTAKLPGPILYGLVLVVALYLAPYQVSGLASGMEIAASLALMTAVIVSARYNKRWLTGVLLIALTIVFSLVRAGDTDALIRYGTFSEMLTLPSIPLGLVILGWWLGSIGMRREASREKAIRSVRLASAA